MLPENSTGYKEHLLIGVMQGSIGDKTDLCLATLKVHFWVQPLSLPDGTL